MMIGAGLSFLLVVVYVGFLITRGEPFVMHFVRTAETETIEVHHPKHPQPVRFVFTPQGPPLNQTIIADHSVRELPFGKKVFIDVTMKPGLVCLTHQGIELNIRSFGIYVGPDLPDEDPLKKPATRHKWGNALELDFRKPTSDAGSDNTNSVGNGNSTAPTPSP